MQTQASIIWTMIIFKLQDLVLGILMELLPLNSKVFWNEFVNSLCSRSRNGGKIRCSALDSGVAM